MIRFLSLSLKNFLSYGAAPTVINLDRPGTTLILGEDLDNTGSGAGANGVGKTVIINALVYALYDKPISNISKDNLVNNINQKNMIVTLEFMKGDDQYIIHRARKTKAGAAGNWVKLFHNGVDVTPDSVGNTNAEIAKIVGLPFDLFVRICAVSANHVPFLDLKVRHPTEPNQTDIIEQLFDLKTLTQKADLLKIEIKDNEKAVTLHTEKVARIKREHDRHATRIDNAKNKVVIWQDGNDLKITKATTKLEALSQVDVEGQKAAVEAYQIAQADVDEMRADLKIKEDDVKKLVKKAKAISDQINHLKDGDCPYCLQVYAEAATKKSELEIEGKQLENEIVDLLGVTDQLKNTLTTFEGIASRAGDEVTISDMDELYDLQGKISGYEKTIKDLKSANNPMQSTVDELEAEELDPIDMDQINKLTTTITHQKFLLKLLTKKDSFVRKALLNKNIPFLNNRLATYLQELGLRHTVEFTHEMTASISQFGRPMDFGNLSNGQRARVNLALSFAFRDVLQSIHEKVNVCMLDEVLDVGLDAIGVQAAAKMLKNKAREEGISMYIISHRDEIDSAFDRTMNIQLTKGFSYLGEDIE